MEFVLDAANDWLTELKQRVIPGTQSEEELIATEERCDRLMEAIYLLDV
jgi:hypothetical protein